MVAIIDGLWKDLWVKYGSIYGWKLVEFIGGILQDLF